MAPRYEIRAALRSDHAGLLELARYLDSVNLPNDPGAVKEVVDASEDAFAEAEGDPRRRQYVFVLRDLEEDRCVGTSMVLGQKGRKDAPYIFLDVFTEEKYSQTLDRHFVHTVLSIAYSYKGPTEIGGLVMHPDYRRAPEKLGMLISYVRFLFIAMHREWFNDQVLAELLPPLEKDGTSYLWEAVGRKFIGMSYREADRLSKRNKEFIRGLFPDGDIYASLLPPEAQDVIGKVGLQTRGVEKLLRRIGFRYAHRVDPFDGGPHFTAPTDEIALVQRSARGTAEIGAVPEGGLRCLVAAEHDGAPYFHAVAAPAFLTEDAVRVEPETASHLGVEAGDELWALPLD